MRFWAAAFETISKMNFDQRRNSRMKKRILVLTLVLCLSLTGCSSMLERDYVIVAPYEPVSYSSGSSSSLRVENYQELVNAVQYLVTMGKEQGFLTLYNYTQDVETDLTRACLEVIQEDPLGAYSVEYITHDYSLIVSYYEVTLQISYRRSREQVASISSVSGSGATRRMIGQALTEFSPETVLRISFFTENEDYILDLIRQTYYESPVTALGMPEAEVYIYPNSGSQRIVEIGLTYPASTEVLQQQSQDLAALALSLVAEDSSAQSLYDCVTDGLTISEGSRKSSTYDALVRKESDSEGAALAYQLLCDQAGIECVLVQGTLNGVPHFWNIAVNEAGEYRHMDLSRGLSALTDEELTTSGTYAWDGKEYPACPASIPTEEPGENEKIEEN